MIPVLITSGKGGTGKTTVALNTAVNLARRGIKVSYMDADLLAPTSHLLMNVNKEKLREGGRYLLPLKVSFKVGSSNAEIEFMGLGAFIPRGVGVALNYEKTTDFITTFLKYVRWGGDYLIIDAPPGAIDINVKLMKELRSKARAVVVGEPHIFAVEDNLRMIDLLKFFDIDVRAVVLNKFNMFDEEVSKQAVSEYEKLGFKIIKIPWDIQLQRMLKPELFNEVAEVIV